MVTPNNRTKMTGAENLCRCNSFEEELGRVDPQREQFLLEKIKEFLAKIKLGDKVLIACHPDADGFVSGALLKAFVDRFFEGQVQTEFCTDELKTQEFYDKAKDFKHVITGDLWIDEKEEKQQGLRALLESGINIMVFDHHDKAFKDLDPLILAGMIATGLSYASTIPESMKQGLRTGRGEFEYISPKRLGFKGSDSNKLTGGLIIYKMLGQLADLSDLEFLLPISAKGDGDAGNKFWPKLVEKYAGHDQRVGEIADTLNLGKNLTLQAAERLMTWLLSISGSENTYEQIDESAEMSDLKKVRAHIRAKLEEFLNQGIKIEQRFLHCHVTQGDEREARRGLNGDLNPHLELDIGLANEICRRFGEEITILVTQARNGHNGDPREIHISARDERDGEEYDVSEIMKNWGGGGHMNAGGGSMIIQEGWTEEAVIELFREEVRRVANSY